MAIQKRHMSRRQAHEKLLNTIGEGEAERYFYTSIRNSFKCKLATPSVVKDVNHQSDPDSRTLLVGNQSDQHLCKATSSFTCAKNACSTQPNNSTPGGYSL